MCALFNQKHIFVTLSLHLTGNGGKRFPGDWGTTTIKKLAKGTSMNYQGTNTANIVPAHLLQLSEAVCCGFGSLWSDPGTRFLCLGSNPDLVPDPNTRLQKLTY
jgi:hypothetical protein